MSVISLNFEEYEDFALFEHDDTDGILQSPVEPLNERHQNLNDAKLFVSIKSIEGLPQSDGALDRFLSGSFSVVFVLGNEKFKRKLAVSSHNATVGLIFTDKDPFIFNVVDYYGSMRFKCILKNKNSFTRRKRIVGEFTASLSELVDKQRSHDASNKLDSISWYVPNSFYMETDLTLKSVIDSQSKVSFSHTTWLATAKSAAIASSGSVGLAKTRNTHTQISSNVDGFATGSLPLQVKIKLEFRVVFLQHCLQISSKPLKPGFLMTMNSKMDKKVSSEVSHHISELQGFLTCARPPEVVEILRSLAATQSLSRGLRLKSSSGYTALEWALLAGNEPVVTVILQRAGNLCFRDLVTGSQGPFHSAVLGGSRECVDTLWRFFKRYSGSNAIAYPAGVQHWSPTLSALLEWRDENDDTPLSLACSMPTRSTSIVELLLFAGSNIAAVNSRTDFTPLMQASFAGYTAAVRILLSISRTSAELDDTLYGTNVVSTSGSNNQDNALQRHLRTNARSKNILRGRDSATGGYMNLLSLYCCNPTCRERDNGRQAIHLAAASGYGEIVCLLLGIGISCAETDRHGDNVFHLLARGGHYAASLSAMRHERSQWSSHATMLRSRQLQTMNTRKKALLVVNCRGRSAVDEALLGGYFSLAVMLMESAIDIYYRDTLHDNAVMANPFDEVLHLLRDAAASPPADVMSVITKVAHHLVSNSRHSACGGISKLQPPLAASTHTAVDAVTKTTTAIADATGQQRQVPEEEKEVDDFTPIMGSGCVRFGGIQPNDDETKSLIRCQTAEEVSKHEISILIEVVRDMLSSALTTLRACAFSNKVSARGTIDLCDEGEEKVDDETSFLFDDIADSTEYNFALSALALKNLGGDVSVPSTASAIVTTTTTDNMARETVDDSLSL